MVQLKGDEAHFSTLINYQVSLITLVITSAMLVAQI